VRRVYDTSYGGRDECLSLMQRAGRAIADIERMRDDLADLKARTDRLRRDASYRNDTDTIPTQESLQSSARVLLEESWDVYRALLR